MSKIEVFVDDEFGNKMLMVPKRQSEFEKYDYVFLFKPSKHSKTKVVIREKSVCMGIRHPMVCEDGKKRTVSLVGDFIVAGNVYDQNGASLGPNNLNYYVKPLNFEFDRKEYDVKFKEEVLMSAKQE